jgi:CubicO group peptidase (beta-lactamase class C family)
VAQLVCRRYPSLRAGRPRRSRPHPNAMMLFIIIMAPLSAADSPAAYWPTHGWKSAPPESLGMSPDKLQAASAWIGSLQSPDAFLVVRGGYLVEEKYWGATTNASLHDLESGTKSIGAIALAHAIHAGYFTPDTNVSQYLPIAALNPAAAAVPLQMKHLMSMAGGANVSYWQGRDPASYGERDWGWRLRHGPPGAVGFCSQHGILKTPGSDFLYSFANPALAEGVLKATTGMGYSEYCAKHLFKIIGIMDGEWRWLGDREGNSQPDGGSFHTARNYAKLFFLMLRGKWEVNGTVAQLLSPAYLEGLTKPTPSTWGPCPIYSHFCWRKDLNHGIPPGQRRVPADTFYAYGGGGQFAVVVPSLDLVVVSLYGGKPAKFHPPPDVAQYTGNQYFPTPDDLLISDTDCDGGMGAPRSDRRDMGCWNITFAREQVGIAAAEGAPRVHKVVPGMPSCQCTASDDAPNDLLAGMMQRVVASIL